MAFTYGFFNSFKGDRKYDAEQISEIFDGILKDGIIPSIGQLFDVNTAENGMQITVGTGRAWFDHTWSKNDSVMVLTVPQSDITRPRYDAVVLEVNHEQDIRANAIKIVSGEAAVNPVKPALVNTERVHQYPLAYILVPAAAETIAAEDIENMVGLEPTVFATGILETVPIDDLWSQWQGEWRTWFEGIKLQLSGDIVTNLQLQIENKVDKADKASLEEALSGTDDTKWMTPLKVRNVANNVFKIGDIRSSLRNLENETDGAYIQADGRALIPDVYPALFDVIGFAYGLSENSYAIRPTETVYQTSGGWTTSPIARHGNKIAVHYSCGNRSAMCFINATKTSLTKISEINSDTFNFNVVKAMFYIGETLYIISRANSNDTVYVYTVKNGVGTRIYTGSNLYYFTVFDCRVSDIAEIIFAAKQNSSGAYHLYRMVINNENVNLSDICTLTYTGSDIFGFAVGDFVYTDADGYSTGNTTEYATGLKRINIWSGDSTLVTDPNILSISGHLVRFIHSGMGYRQRIISSTNKKHQIIVDGLHAIKIDEHDGTFTMCKLLFSEALNGGTMMTPLNNGQWFCAIPVGGSGNIYARFGWSNSDIMNFSDTSTHQSGAYGSNSSSPSGYIDGSFMFSTEDITFVNFTALMSQSGSAKYTGADRLMSIVPELDFFSIPKLERNDYIRAQ